MNSFDDIIAQAQRYISCPKCGRSFSLGEIHLKGFFDNTFILEATCSNGHPSVVTLFVASYRGQSLKSEDVIAAKDVESANNQIDDFDGNFQEIWKS